MPAPTYWTETTAEGEKVYHCCYCEAAGQEHHSSDEVLFIQHQEQRHDGRMVEDVEASAAARQAPADHPQGGPPGQTGEHPEHPHGGPPGQTGEHPDTEPTPHPEHPIVLPDEPYVEHHEEPKP